MQKFRLFGVTIETDWHFATNIIQVKQDSPTDLQYTQLTKPGSEYRLHKENLFYQSQYKTETDEPFFCGFQFPDCYILNYTNSVRFYLFPNQIFYQPLENFTHYQTETYLLSNVLAIWLESQGTVCLHASALVVNQSVLAFLANSGGGKTTLAMSMLQEGYSLLSDDILPVRQAGNEFYGQPAFPTMRVWPELAKNFIEFPEQLTRMAPEYEKRILPIGTGIFGHFTSTPVPIRRFYLLERLNAESETTVKILPVPPSHAVMELIKHSFASRSAEGMGLSMQRLRVLANLATNVSIRKLIYPCGIDRLGEVRQAILKDLM